MGVSAAFHLAEAGARSSCSSATSWPAARPRRPRAACARSSRRAEHRDRQAQPGGVQALRAAAGLGDRLRGDRLPLRAHHRGRGRRVHAQRRAAERARRAVADDHARRGAGALPAARGRGHPGGQLLPDGRARDARVGRAGLRVRRAPARRAPRVSTPVEGIDAATASSRACARRTGRWRPARSSAPRAPGRARAGRWSACSSTSRRCAARCCSPRRWPTCRPSSR